MKKIGVAAVGDVTSISSFSGTPYHFLEASQRAGWDAYGWKMDLNKIKLFRYAWNIKQLLQLEKRGGYQYSLDFAKRIANQIPSHYFSDTIISFNQHFPPADMVYKNGGKLYHYIDATFTQLIDRYGIGEIIGNKIKKETLSREKEFFEMAEHIVTFQNRARESVINDYGISPKKVSVVLPGANFNLPLNLKIATTNFEGIGKEKPLVLGFIGKEWRRKGLDIIIESAELLIKQGYKVEVHCAGYAPQELINNPIVKFLGFINKATEPEKFLEFLQSCHIGCLFSKAEFSSISVFEFLRAGVPVAGYIVDGMGDLYFPEASIRFNPTDDAIKIADKLSQFLEDSLYRVSLQQGAFDKSNYVTWDRCITEWNEILTK